MGVSKVRELCLRPFHPAGVEFDGNGVLDDECPDDPDKTAPGVCGCGVADTDGDSDGNYACPNPSSGVEGSIDPHAVQVLEKLIESSFDYT